MVPSGLIVEGAVWEDDVSFWGFDIGVDLLIGEEWKDLESVLGVAMNVAGIFY